MLLRIIFGSVAVLMIGIFFFSDASAQDSNKEPLPQTAPSIPFKQKPDLHAGSVYRVVAVTLLAIGLAVGGTWLIRKYLLKKGLMRSAPDNLIAVMATKRISPKLTVYLVAIDGQEYVISQSGDKSVVIKHKSIKDG